MKHLLFLSGLPRSGSTLLGSILSQNPLIQSTPTSPLADLLCIIDEGFSRLDIQYTFDKDETQFSTYRAVLSNFYNHIQKPYVIDKHRGWPKNIKSIERFLGYIPKIIATNRRIPEVLASYILLIQKNNNEDNFIDNHLRSEGKEITIDNRVHCLWTHYISESYESLVISLENHPDNIHLVDYNNLVKDPQNELNKIYDFLEFDHYNHNFLNITNECAEQKDKEWGLDNLHKIRSTLGRTSPPPEEIIGIENTKLYDKFNI